MTISMNDNDAPTPDVSTQGVSTQGGAFADGLTCIRIALTPLIMFVIIKAWSAKPDDPMGFVSLNLEWVLLASILFVIAALTDILDDFIGGGARAEGRRLGWIDDIADSVLVSGTLLALAWVSYTAGLLHWSFYVPVAALIGRDILIGIIKGHQLSKFGLLESRLGDIKGALAMLSVCILVASPWLSNVLDGLRAGNTAEGAMHIYNNPSPWVWIIGVSILWVAALLSLITGLKILATSKPNLEEDI